MNGKRSDGSKTGRFLSAFGLTANHPLTGGTWENEEKKIKNLKKIEDQPNYNLLENYLFVFLPPNPKSIEQWTHFFR